MELYYTYLKLTSWRGMLNLILSTIEPLESVLFKFRIEIGGHPKKALNDTILLLSLQTLCGRKFCKSDFSYYFFFFFTEESPEKKVKGLGNVIPILSCLVSLLE